MKEKWPKAKIGDVAESITDYVANGSFASLAEHVHYKNTEDFAVLIRLVDYNNNFSGNFVFIDEHAYNFLNKSKLYGGEIIISNVGANVGTVFRCPYLKYKMSLAPNAIMVKFKGDNNFYYYWLSSYYGQSMLKSIATGSAQPKFNKTNFKEILVPIPPFEVQKKIAGVLGALDDKIELNNKINQNLEAQAQALFKSWFVDFEPFGGKMPDDWKIGKLGEIIKITSGKRPLFKCNNKDKFVSIPIVGASDIMGYTNEVLYHDKILITGRVGTHGVIQRFCDACWPSDNTLVLFSNSYEYVYQCLKRIDFSAMNRGSTQPLITQNDLKNCDIIIPSEVWLNKFEHTAGKLLALNENNEKENTQLTELRDTLLPKLMSGEINVDDVKILADKSSFTGEI